MVSKNNTPVLIGTRNYKDGLYDIPIYRDHPNPKKTLRTDNVILPKLHGLPCQYTTSPLASDTVPVLPSISKRLQRTTRNPYDIRTISKNCLVSLLTTSKHADQKANVILRRQQKHSDLAEFLHGCCGSPVPSTFITGIENEQFLTWPGLTPELIKKHLPPSRAMTKGHLHQEAQHLQSTKQHEKNDYLQNIKANIARLRTKYGPNKSFKLLLENDIKADAFPVSPTPNIKTNHVIYALIESSAKGMGYIDLTGKFPFRSAKGNQYIVVAYHYDGNAIIGKAIKNRESKSITQAWQALNTSFATAGTQPKSYIVDNEASLELKQAMKKEQIDYQLVPPHNHRANYAERAIQTFKSHFKAILATCDPAFPLAQWDLLLPQANLTLNLLRSARSNPKLSAHAYLFGNFNFQATPLAPPGTRVIAYKTSNTRTTWGSHGEDGWYVGPALEHYRCVSVYFPSTRTVRVVDTVRYFPTIIPFPQTSLTDHLRQAASDIIAILSKPPSQVTPELQSGDKIQNALLDLATIFKNSANIPNLPERKSVSISKPLPLPRVSLHNKPLPIKHVPHKSLPRVPRKPTDLIEKLQQSKYERKPSNNRYNLRSKIYPHSYTSRAARTLLAQHIFSTPASYHIYDASGKRLTIDKLIKGDNKETWLRSLSMEFGRLAQGNIHGVQSTDTIDFIAYHEVPSNEKVTYAQCVCDHRPLKPEKFRVRIVVGGDKLDCHIDAGAPSTNLAEFKMLVNSVISEHKHGAKFMSCDLKDFFLASPMKQPKYMKMKYSIFPPDIIKKYNLDKLVTNDGFIYIKIKKGMYGLQEAAVLAYDQLSGFLNKYGYKHVPGTAGLWKHDTKPTAFCLCVDDIGLKYYSEDDLQHFLTSIRNHYEYHIDPQGKHYIGLTLHWNYEQGFVDIAMPNYISKLLQRLNHIPPNKPTFSPHEHYPVTIIKKGERQYVKSPDTTTPLDPKETKRIQSIVGALLYYARSIDNTILPALNDISMFQSKPTQKIKDKCDRLLNYVATYPNVVLRYYASNMQLHVDSDAAYLVAPKARSRIAGFYYFKQGRNGLPLITPNHPILVECRCLKHVVSSAAEAETAAIFYNAQNILLFRRILQALGHPQLPTPIKTDNATANGFIHNNIHLRKSKTWDMRYYWLRDRETQKQIAVHWKRGIDENDPNLADYPTKHHSTIHHRGVRPLYVRDST